MILIQASTIGAFITGGALVGAYVGWRLGVSVTYETTRYLARRGNHV